MKLMETAGDAWKGHIQHNQTALAKWTDFYHGEFREHLKSFFESLPLVRDWGFC
jgi:hypothetical protein